MIFKKLQYFQNPPNAFSVISVPLWQISKFGCVFALAVLSLWASPALLACDDALLNMLTADDPGSAFCRGIMTLNREISTLGSALSAQTGNYESTLQKLMEAWISFTSKFAVNPPEKAKNDPQWQKKMVDIGERIGRIRKAVNEKNDSLAHTETLALHGQLTTLFEAVELSGLKRLFLNGSELFLGIEEFRLRGNMPAFRACVASLQDVVATLTPQIGSDTQPLHRQLIEELKNLQDYTATATATDTKNVLVLAILNAAASDFQELRAKLMAKELFPNGIPQIATPTGETP